MSTSLRPAFVNHLLIYALGGLFFSGSIGLGTVWMQHEISLTANENKALEARIAAVERESEQLTTEIAEESDSSALLRRNAAWKLGLVPPAPNQVQAVAGDPLRRLSAKQASDSAEGAPGRSAPPQIAFGR